MATFASEQEAFWAGAFGSEYTERNQGALLQASNTHLFARILSRAREVRSVLELGANRGLNLEVLRSLLPGAELAGIEINPDAAALLSESGFTTFAGSLLDFVPDRTRDLVFTKGVLIHISPDALPRAYDLIHAASSRYLLVAEYYNPTPVEVSYRGHAERLFKRDFAGEIMARHADVRLVDYGFVYRRDPMFPQDDLTWFLMEKSPTAL